jgi:hypothetical protein
VSETGSSDYLDSLSGELGAVGIDGARRRRIVAEFADHLDCDPQAELGPPAVIARRFADELGTALARRAAFRAFDALALAGLLFAAALATGTQFSRATTADVSAAVVLGLVVCAVAAQVSFVAGGLGLLRGVRLRREPVIATVEARVLVRRAAIGLGAGAVTMLALPLIALAAPGPYYTTWRVLAYVFSAVGILAILLAVPAVFAAARLVPVAEGEAGDLFSDIGPAVPPILAGAPRRFALAVAGALALMVAAAGAAASDPYDGLLRGLLEGAACLAGFALLGRYLGLRSQGR